MVLLAIRQCDMASRSETASRTTRNTMQEVALCFKRGLRPDKAPEMAQMRDGDGGSPGAATDSGCGAFRFALSKTGEAHL